MTANKPALTGVPRDLTDCTTDELIDIAAMYGKVTMFGSHYADHPYCYKVDIDFNTREHTKMSASSERYQTPRAALCQAIENARDMIALAKELSP